MWEGGRGLGGKLYGMGVSGGREEPDLVLGEGKGLKPWSQQKEWKQATSGDQRMGGPSRMYQGWTRRGIKIWTVKKIIK